MKPPVFEYHAPGSTDEALALLGEHAWEAKILAGGQSLVPAMNFRLASPAILIDINGVDELSGIETAADGSLRIGAMTRQNVVESSDQVRAAAPLLHKAMPWIAHPQIRARGTLGGSIAHADPAAELPAVMLALGAEFHARGPSGERAIPADEFFFGLLMTALAPDEMLTAISIPAQAPRSGTAFVEFARRHGDYALAGVAVTLTLGSDGTCESAALGLLSVSEAPMLAVQAASALVGTAVELSDAEGAAELAAGEIDPTGDLHASADYRRHLVRVLVRRAVVEARAGIEDRG
ncbi:MAG: xanthine dehydrogenase family protein subunit M [Acidobacteria bacterium]|nr:xanthine dehydrogenase family protein subunit M [Acidobacteriota bacterium]